MRLGVVLRTTGPTPRLDMDLVLEAERLGCESAWTSEAWGGDAVSTASWVLARTTRIKVGTGIMQMPARTPSCAAMTAMSLQALSGDRFLLGIGPSGPQVIEGWHGVPYGKPLTRTRE
jgi:alkanesulfonate monooxygenase SsuD/methylene tetrahydromethanopterin reductase-like flavin-dependent oxidoreductase (luciferase family)